MYAWIGASGHGLSHELGRVFGHVGWCGVGQELGMECPHGWSGLLLVIIA